MIMRFVALGEANKFGLDCLESFQDFQDKKMNKVRDQERERRRVKEQERNSDQLKELIRIKTEVQKDIESLRAKKMKEMEELIEIKTEVKRDIESLRDKKMKEMEELLEIKTSKELSKTELEELRLDIRREKNIMESLHHQRTTGEAMLKHQHQMNARGQGTKPAIPVSQSEGVSLPQGSAVLEPIRRSAGYDVRQEQEELQQNKQTMQKNKTLLDLVLNISIDMEMSVSPLPYQCVFQYLSSEEHTIDTGL